MKKVWGVLTGCLALLVFTGCSNAVASTPPKISAPKKAIKFDESQRYKFSFKATKGAKYSVTDTGNNTLLKQGTAKNGPIKIKGNGIGPVKIVAKLNGQKISKTLKLKGVDSSLGLGVGGYDNPKTIHDSSSSSSSAASESTSSSQPEYSTAITFDNLARTPDQFEGKSLQMTGEVLQVVEGDEVNNLRVAINGNHDDVVLVEYDPAIMDGTRILENDKVTFYGTSLGTTSYKSTMDGKITLPNVAADKITDAGTAPEDYGL